MPEAPMPIEPERYELAAPPTYRFAVDPVRRMRLLNGWDDIDVTESYRSRIAAFRVKDKSERPWAEPRC